MRRPRAWSLTAASTAHVFGLPVFVSNTSLPAASRSSSAASVQLAARAGRRGGAARSRQHDSAQRSAGWLRTGGAPTFQKELASEGLLDEVHFTHHENRGAHAHLPCSAVVSGRKRILHGGPQAAHLQRVGGQALLAHPRRRQVRPAARASQCAVGLCRFVEGQAVRRAVDGRLVLRCCCAAAAAMQRLCVRIRRLLLLVLAPWRRGGQAGAVLRCARASLACCERRRSCQRRWRRRRAGRPLGRHCRAGCGRSVGCGRCVDHGVAATQRRPILCMQRRSHSALHSSAAGAEPPGAQRALAAAPVKLAWRRLPAAGSPAAATAVTAPQARRQLCRAAPPSWDVVLRAAACTNQRPGWPMRG